LEIIVVPMTDTIISACNSIVQCRQHMSLETDATDTLDVKGASCPMPVVKTKQAVDNLSAGDLLEVVATDSGSMSDIDGWASGTDGVSLVDQEERAEGGESIYVHYVRVEE